MKKQRCASCGAELQKKNEISINKKLLGEKTKAYYCMDCLAEYLDVTVQDIRGQDRGV